MHDERGRGAANAGMRPSWGPVVARYEAAVDEEVPRRLVPLEEVVKFFEVAVLLDLGVTAFDVAQHSTFRRP